MKYEEKIKAGETFILTNGEYSDFGYDVMRALRDFDLAKVAEFAKDISEYESSALGNFMDILVKEKFAEIVELRTIHAGEYGRIEFEP